MKNYSIASVLNSIVSDIHLMVVRLMSRLILYWCLIKMISLRGFMRCNPLNRCLNLPKIHIRKADMYEDVENQKCQFCEKTVTGNQQFMVAGKNLYGKTGYAPRWLKEETK